MFLTLTCMGTVVASMRQHMETNRPQNHRSALKNNLISVQVRDGGVALDSS